MCEFGVNRVMSPLNERDEQIARRARDLVFQQVYAEIGQSLVKRSWWLLTMAVAGLLGVAGYSWLGKSPPPAPPL